MRGIVGLAFAGIGTKQMNEFIVSGEDNWENIRAPAALYLIGTYMNPAILPGQKLNSITAILTHIVAANSVAQFSEGFSSLKQRNWKKGASELIKGSVFAIIPCVLAKTSFTVAASGVAVVAVSGAAASVMTHLANRGLQLLERSFAFV